MVTPVVVQVVVELWMDEGGEASALVSWCEVEVAGLCVGAVAVVPEVHHWGRSSPS